jgi:CDP-glucose 4,6-dehydratase
VLDPLHGYILLAERLLKRETQFASAFNFGPALADSWTVERIANKLAELWGEGAGWTRDSEPGVHENQSLRLDATKAHEELGWQPRLNIETALEWTAEWHRRWQQGAEMQKETLAEIARYEQLGQ